MDKLSNVMWLHPKPSEIRKFVSNLCRSMVQKEEVSKFFCPKSAHARSILSRFYGIAERACLHHVLIEVIKIFTEYPSESSSS